MTESSKPVVHRLKNCVYYALGSMCLCFVCKPAPSLSMLDECF